MQSTKEQSDNLEIIRLKKTIKNLELENNVFKEMTKSFRPSEIVFDQRDYSFTFENNSTHSEIAIFQGDKKFLRNESILEDPAPGARYLYVPNGTFSSTSRAALMPMLSFVRINDTQSAIALRVMDSVTRLVGDELYWFQLNDIDSNALAAALPVNMIVLDIGGNVV
jgi:hypothetical protein